MKARTPGGRSPLVGMTCDSLWRSNRRVSDTFSSHFTAVAAAWRIYYRRVSAQMCIIGQYIRFNKQ